MMGNRAWAVALAAIVGLVAPSALADAVPMPPDDCPPGSVGDSCHGGEYCRLAGCSDDSDCSGSKTCQEVQLCVGQIDCAGGWDPEAGPSYSTTVEGTCPGGTGCSGSQPCELRHACAEPGAGSAGGSADSDPVTVGGCGCTVVGRADDQPAWLFALALAALGISRRRARRARI